MIELDKEHDSGSQSLDALNALTRRSFWHFFQHHLKPGGLYVIEDWGTGYWSDWPDGAAATGASAWPAIFGAVVRRLRRKRASGTRATTSAWSGS